MGVKNMKDNILNFFNRSTGEVYQNSLGYQQVISTLTAVSAKLTTQKFYELAPADYVPLVVGGQGAFQRSILHYRSFSKGEGFAAGLINNAGNNSRLSKTDSAYDALSQNIMNWAVAIEWNLFELQEAMASGNLFSLIESREIARRKSWDLGIQQTAFVGLAGETGLLNNANVSADTATITKKISAMTSAEFNTFVTLVYEVYRAAVARTAKPTHFVMPESDWNGLMSYPLATDGTLFALKTKADLLLEAFRTITNNPSFKILPCAYCDKANSPDATNNFYVMLNYDPTSLSMSIPIDYTPLAAGTVNGFTFENVAYGSLTGVVAQRPKELVYFTNTAS
jgi:hypothetical protein